MTKHVAEVVTQESPPDAPGFRTTERHYLTCSCGYNGELRRLFEVAVEDKSAHLEAARKKAEEEAAVA